MEKMFISDVGESVIAQKETIKISLIPVDPLSVKNFQNNLSLRAQDVRIKKSEIHRVFDNIKALAEVQKSFEKKDIQ
jgi:hypothetical protein